MTIKGLASAIKIAEDRVQRIQENICIVEIAKNEYVLWRQSTISTISLSYTYYRIVKVINYDTGH